MSRARSTTPRRPIKGYPQSPFFSTGWKSGLVTLPKGHRRWPYAADPAPQPARIPPVLRRARPGPDHRLAGGTVDPAGTARVRRTPVVGRPRRDGAGAGRRPGCRTSGGRSGPGGGTPGRTVVGLAARRSVRGGARFRPAAPTVAARASWRRPVRSAGSDRARRRARRGGLRRTAGRSRGRQHPARQRPADHVRAGDRVGPGRPDGGARRPDRHPATGAPRLPGRGLPALGPAPRDGLPRSAAPGPAPGAPAQAARASGWRISCATASASRS